MNQIEKSILEEAMTYQQYVENAEDLLKQGRASTTDFMGNSKDILHYAELNLARMRRLDKTVRLLPETLATLEKMNAPMTWLCISEGWCGDASQVVPVVEAMAVQLPNVQHRIVFRDENLDLMNAFLTNGGQAIPKFIILDENQKVLGAWGPRPDFIQQQVDIWKKQGETLSKEERAARFEELKVEVQKMYNADKTRSIQQEFCTFLREIL